MSLFHQKFLSQVKHLAYCSVSVLWSSLYLFSDIENTLTLDVWSPKTIALTCNPISFIFVIDLPISSLSQYPFIEVSGRLFTTYLQLSVLQLLQHLLPRSVVFVVSLKFVMATVLKGVYIFDKRRRKAKWIKAG